MIDPEHYYYSVIWSEEDGGFVGLCAEFLSLSYLDENNLKALEGITNLLKEVVTDMMANDEVVPIPLVAKKDDKLSLVNRSV